MAFQALKGQGPPGMRAFKAIHGPEAFKDLTGLESLKGTL
jgi:hypothetical protein